MKKIFNKENLIAILSYTIVFLIIYFLLTRNNKIFGSTTDFVNQHYLIPEYFRTLFYDTKDLLPDFSMNLSGGINIFYLAYYGLLNPIIIISYLFPNISMLNYIIISTSILSVSSSILYYFYLRKNKYSFTLSFIGGFLFLLAGPVIFHTHRHIMFINYLFFLILGMFGVDLYFEKKNILLLTISIFLIILTSYYYSIGCILSLLLLGIYKYLKNNVLLEKKKVFVDLLKYSIPYIIGVMLGAIIIMPAAYVILNSRGASNTAIPLTEILVPHLNFKYLLYNSYAIGTSFISVLACFYFIYKGKIEDKFLSIFFLLIGSFGLFNYILNGTLYVEAKSLIPFLPLLLINTTNFLKLLFNNKINKKVLIFLSVAIIIFAGIDIAFNIINNPENKGFVLGLDKYAYSGFLILEAFFFILIIKIKNGRNYNVFKYYLVIASFVFCFIINCADKYMNKPVNTLLTDSASVIDNILIKDKSFYRISNLVGDDNYNRIYNAGQNQTSVYSSTNNKNMKSLFYDTFKNAMFYRNREMLTSGTNPLFNIFMSEKYIISKLKLNYPIMNKYHGIYTYKNNNAYPLGYAISNIINEKDYQKASYIDQELYMLNSAIIPNGKTNLKLTNRPKEDIKYTILKSDNLDITTENNQKRIYSYKGKLKLQLPDNYKNGILFISFKNNTNPSCKDGDLSITINEVRNKLTCKDWKYHNNNYTFYYSLNSSNILDISFSKGEFLLSDFEIYYISNEELNNNKNNIVPLNVTYQKGDIIKGSITPKEDGYFILQIPYDKGFNISIDNKKQEYQKVNNGVIGFKISKGKHDINIEYKAPFKNIGIITNLIGFLLLIGASYFYRHPLKKRI